MKKSFLSILLGFLLVSHSTLATPCLCVEEEQDLHDASIETVANTIFSIRIYIIEREGFNLDPWSLVSNSNPMILQPQGAIKLILKRPAHLDWSSGENDPNLYPVDPLNVFSYLNTATWRSVGRQWIFQAIEAGDTVLTFKNSKKTVSVTVTVTPSHRSFPGYPVETPEDPIFY